MTGYIIKMILCSGILLLAYMLLFEKEKMHRFNRWYLLVSMVFPLLVPFISMQGPQEVIPFSEPVYIVIAKGETVKSPAVQDTASSFNPIVLIYVAVTAFLIFRFVKNLASLIKKINAHEKLRYESSTLVLCNNHPVPYSFLNYIFIDNQATIEKEILQHELTHARQKHSLDVIFTELLLCFTWFNPFMWAYKRSIQLNHEFLADKAVTETFQNTTSYQYLLLEKIQQRSHSMLTSSFNYLITKKRLIMMTKISSPLTVAIKQIVVFPLLAVLIFLFSTKLVAQVVPEPVKTNETPSVTKDTTQPRFWSLMSIGHTKEGASPELMKEYQDIVMKYKSPSDSINWRDFTNISKQDRARLETIFKQMSIAQQGVQTIAFTRNPPPLAKVVPTPKQFEAFKNPNVYGVWINDKRVPNEKLNDYKNTDFSQVFISKLYAAAKKGRNYTHQLNLMTNDYYAGYRKEALARSAETVMVVMWRRTKSLQMHQIH